MKAGAAVMTFKGRFEALSEPNEDYVAAWPYARDAVVSRPSRASSCLAEES